MIKLHTPSIVGQLLGEATHNGGGGAVNTPGGLSGSSLGRGRAQMMRPGAYGVATGRGRAMYRSSVTPSRQVGGMDRMSRSPGGLSPGKDPDDVAVGSVGGSPEKSEQSHDDGQATDQCLDDSVSQATSSTESVNGKTEFQVTALQKKIRKLKKMLRQVLCVCARVWVLMGGCYD